MDVQTHTWRIPGPGVHAQLTQCKIQWKDLKWIVDDHYVKISEMFGNATVYKKKPPFMLFSLS